MPEPVDFTGPDEPRRAIVPTQSAHPWRATARTALAFIVAAGVVMPVVLGIVLETLGVYLPPEAVTALRWIVGLIGAVSLAVTRIIAIPQVNGWLARVGLSAAPRDAE